MSFSDFHGWIAQHSLFAGLAVFLVSMAESLAVVGLLVPGVALMFGAGALVGTGALAFGPVCAYAVAGAIAGDGLSFWAGWHYRRQILSLWPFSRYPAMIQRGVEFFGRYGGRSVLFGRFVGPVRAVIPLVAGMLAMPVRRFLGVNILSALLWAPAYLLPGMVFGASIDLASQVAGRLAALATALLAVLWFTAWISKRLYVYFRPRAHGFILYTLDLGREHPWLGRLTVPLIDPSRRDYAGLLAWALLLGSGAMVLSLLVPADRVALSLQAWRHPWADYALTVLEDLGGSEGAPVFTFAVATWLLIRRRRLAAAHFLLGAGCALVLGEVSGLPFGSPLVDAPVLNGTVAFGFAAVLAADRAAVAWRWLAYSSAALVAVTLAFARIYLGGGAVLAVVFTLALALVWLLLLGVAYRRHAVAEPATAELPWVVLAVAATLAGALGYRHSVDEFGAAVLPIPVAEADWLAEDWRRLPAYRVQAFGRPHQPLVVQWAANLEDLRAELARDGWQSPQPLGLVPVLKTLNPAAAIPDLPVLPHYNQAEADALRLIRRAPDGRWLIARFWDSGFRLEPGSLPLWLGSVAYLEPRGLPGLVKFADEVAGGSAPLRELAAELGTRRIIETRTAGEGETVLLIPPVR